ncbi:ribulose-phosphate 3-epimerase [Desulfocurvibacter africanus]|uniref:Ribulose-phosphate 3-epimerase n=1 Tax=Desulfocurvibacter africanus subsp. africanus str. Walvis Bay TaxID=690850 RepID=F3Z0E7_DESAF|nr:ribulose-phosphate 3-epimerase [Desulfocurvibacter africanus]EGJ50957.1 ribulose-phosphate 3-epimerase [Desulfocurvibacter africanus subsp. africanus str. Walvis Bay]
MSKSSKQGKEAPAAKKIILSPSLLSADFGRLADELAALEEGGIEWVHWDVMDGVFVPNITFGPPVIKALRNRSKLFFDCHLMVIKPERYINDFLDAGANLICVHAEATSHLERTVSQIREAGIKAAVALNPATSLASIEYLLPELDMVLIMSVNPGFGGQVFIPFSLEKIRRLRKMIDEQGAKTLIQVDGGITPENIAPIVDAGAEVIVSGSSFFKFPPYGKRRELFETLSQVSFGPTGL